MITITARGNYWKTSDAVFLMLKDEQELENVYRFFVSNGQEKICFTSRNESNITKDDSTGRYRLYEVRNEKTFEDGVYLELCIRAGKWDCYILPTGLPDESVVEKSLFATNKCITKTTRKD